MQQNMRLMLDVSGVDFMVTNVPVPKVRDRKSGAQQLDRESGLPMWSTEVTVMSPSGASVIQITTVGATAPAVSRYEHVTPEALEALPWSNKDQSGEWRMGIAFRAKSLNPAEVPAV